MSQQYSPYVSFLNSATLDDRISIIQDSPKCPNVYFSDLQSFIFLSYHFHITHTTTFKIQFTFQFLCYYFNMSFDIPFLLLICLIFVASHFYLLLLSNPIHLFYLLHNKHFIRHHISQNKVLIIPKSLSFLPRQTIPPQVGRLEATHSTPYPACVKLLSQTFFNFFDRKSLKAA